MVRIKKRKIKKIAKKPIRREKFINIVDDKLIPVSLAKKLAAKYEEGKFHFFWRSKPASR